MFIVYAAVSNWEFPKQYRVIYLILGYNENSKRAKEALHMSQLTKQEAARLHPSKHLRELAAQQAIDQLRSQEVEGTLDHTQFEPGVLDRPTPRTTTRPPTQRARRILQLTSKGLTPAMIAQETGYGTAYVYYVLKHHNIKPVTNREAKSISAYGITTRPKYLPNDPDSLSASALGYDIRDYEDDTPDYDEGLTE